MEHDLLRKKMIAEVNNRTMQKTQAQDLAKVAAGVAAAALRVAHDADVATNSLQRAKAQASEDVDNAASRIEGLEEGKSELAAQLQSEKHKYDVLKSESETTAEALKQKIRDLEAEKGSMKVAQREPAAGTTSQADGEEEERQRKVPPTRSSKRTRGSQREPTASTARTVRKSRRRSVEEKSPTKPESEDVTMEQEWAQEPVEDDNVAPEPTEAVDEDVMMDEEQEKEDKPEVGGTAEPFAAEVQMALPTRPTVSCLCKPLHVACCVGVC